MTRTDLCYIVVPGNAPGQRIGIVRRGERGYYLTDYDDGELPTKGSNADGWSIETFVDHMNEQLGVTKDEAHRMLCGSMFGWDTPIAQGA